MLLLGFFYLLPKLRQVLALLHEQGLGVPFCRQKGCQFLRQGRDLRLRRFKLIGEPA